VCGASFAAMYLLPHKIPARERKILFGLTCLAGGFTMGPMNYIAQKTNSVLFATALSTTAAFAVTPALTRGWIANAFLSQALSSSFALVAVKIIAATTFPELEKSTLLRDADANPFEKLLSLAALPLNLNMLLLGQVVYNGALVFFTGQPVLSGQTSVSELTEANSQKDALMVVGSVTAAIFRLFQYCVQFILRTVKQTGKTAKDVGTATNEKDKNNAIAQGIANTIGAKDAKTIFEPISGSVSMVSFFILYIKFVTKLQSGDKAEFTLRWLKKVFDNLTPVRVVGTKGAPVKFD
jgi:hypothetical protein